MPDLDPATAGGEGALLAAFVSHRERLVRLARGIVRCPCLAEDVVQEAAMRAMAADAGEGCIACPLGFACRVVRNLAIDRRRSLDLEAGRRAPEELADAVPAPCADPCARLEACEALRAALAALDELPERTRRAFTRHRLGDVPQKVIAAELGVSPTLVNFMVRDAQEHCRSRLRAPGGAGGPRSPKPLRGPRAGAASRPRAKGAPRRALP